MGTQSQSLPEGLHDIPDIFLGDYIMMGACFCQLPLYILRRICKETMSSSQLNISGLHVMNLGFQPKVPDVCRAYCIQFTINSSRCRPCISMSFKCVATTAECKSSSTLRTVWDRGWTACTQERAPWASGAWFPSLLPSDMSDASSCSFHRVMGSPVPDFVFWLPSYIKLHCLQKVGDIVEVLAPLCWGNGQ